MLLIAEAFSLFLIQHVTELLKLVSHLCTSDLIATFEFIHHPFILVGKEKKYSVVYVVGNSVPPESNFDEEH